MSYYTDLAFNLRARKCSEKQVREVLETISESVAAGGGHPENEFGLPKEYAAQYEGTRKASPGQRALTVFGLLGLVQILFQRLFLDVEFFPWGLVFAMAGFVAILVIGVFVATFLDHRLPHGFVTSEVS
ncbi:hypothetical protein [Rhodoglobus aureus]|uniref:Uncharacterized protein n=1 Tax=Rhodoglobus aureus TaxID=191497 RepID=A0ABP4GGN8_9MICO